MTRKVTSLPVTEKNVADGNWNADRQPVDMVILHTMVGTAVGADARFNNPTAQVSAHYGVLLNGSVWHWVDEDMVAFHAGNYKTNQRSIGIEHEDGWNGTAPEPKRPEVLYKAAGKLLAEICNFYKIPIDRQHIKKHNEVSDNPTGCPDALDIDKIISYALGQSPIPNPVGTYMEVDTKEYSRLVHNSSVGDSATSSLGLADKADGVSPDTVSKSIAGIKGDATKARTDLAIAQTEISNKEREIGNLTVKLTDLGKAASEAQKASDLLVGQITTRAEVAESRNTELEVEIADLKKQLAAATGAPVDYSWMTKLTLWIKSLIAKIGGVKK